MGIAQAISTISLMPPDDMTARDSDMAGASMHA